MLNTTNDMIDDAEQTLNQIETTPASKADAEEDSDGKIDYEIVSATNLMNGNFIDPIAGSFPNIDPVESGEPCYSGFSGRQTDAHAMEAIYNDSLSENSEEEEHNTPDDEEANNNEDSQVSSPKENEPAFTEPAQNNLDNQENSPQSTTSEDTSANTDDVESTENALKSSESAEEVSEGIQTPPTVEEGQKPPKRLVCPHCGKMLYCKKSADSQIFLHNPEDAKNCNCYYESLEEIEEDLKKQKERKEKLAQMLAKEKEEQEQREKTAAVLKATNQNNQNRTALSASLVQAGTQVGAEESRLLAEQIMSLSQSQTQLRVTFAEEINAVKLQQEKLALQNEAITEKLATLQSTIQSLNLSDVPQAFEQVNKELEEKLDALEKLKELPPIISQQAKALEDASTDTIHASKYAAQQLVLYANSVRTLKNTDIKLNTTIHYFEEFMRSTDERYKVALEDTLRKYGEEKTTLGKTFEQETQKFFKNAQKKLIENMSILSNKSWKEYTYPCAVSFTFMALILYLNRFLR